MQTIMLDGSLYPTAKDLHLALKMLLSLPECAQKEMQSVMLSDAVKETSLQLRSLEALTTKSGIIALPAGSADR